MAEKTINTRILLKQDSLENWKSSTLALKKGEIVFATAAASLGNGLTEPVVIAKVCTKDGDTFSQCDDAFYAKASDVYAWAKKEAIEFEKVGTGNVVSGFTFENGKVKYTTAAVATSEGLDELQKKVDSAASDITAIQTEIADNKDAWAKDTTYAFAIAEGKLEVTSGGASVASLDIVTPDELTAAMNAAKVAAAVGEHIIEVADNKISATVGIKYNSAQKTIQLIGINGYILGEVDATAFIKDGMVDNVSFDASTKKLTITFNTDAGKEAIEVDMTSLVDTYKAGAGLDLEGDTFSVALDPASESYLSVGAAGIKVAGVDSAIDTAKSVAAADATTKADAALASAKTYADGLAGNYATAAQGTKADTALQSITTTANGGLKVEGNKIDIDDAVTFVFDCGDSN